MFPNRYKITYLHFIIWSNLLLKDYVRQHKFISFMSADFWMDIFQKQVWC